MDKLRECEGVLGIDIESPGLLFLFSCHCTLLLSNLYRKFRLFKNSYPFESSYLASCACEIHAGALCNLSGCENLRLIESECTYDPCAILIAEKRREEVIGHA